MANKMKYGDLVQFEQIESVIQLLDAGRPEGRAAGHSVQPGG